MRPEQIGHKEERAHIPGLFLNPAELGILRVLGEDLAGQLRVKRVDLFDADNRNVLASDLFTTGGQLVIDLAATEHDFLDTLAVCIVLELRVVHQLMESALGQLADIAGGRAEQALGGHHDQRLAEGTLHLSPKRVEDLRPR